MYSSIPHNHVSNVVISPKHNINKNNNNDLKIRKGNYYKEAHTSSQSAAIMSM